MTEDGPLAELSGVGVALGGRPVLGGLHLELCARERVAVVGANGVGKSTLLDLVLGLRPANEGRIRVLGRAPPAPGVGFVPQHPGASLLPWYRVRRNIALPLRVHGAGPEAIAAAVERVRAMLDPDASLDLEAYPGTLSGGQQQLAALMRALVARPPLLLCDEPLSAMDAPSRVRLRERLSAACSAPCGPGLLLVTHDLEDMLGLVDRVLVLAGRPASIVHSIDTNASDARTELARVLSAA